MATEQGFARDREMQRSANTTGTATADGTHPSGSEVFQPPTGEGSPDAPYQAAPLSDNSGAATTTRSGGSTQEAHGFGGPSSTANDANAPAGPGGSQNTSNETGDGAPGDGTTPPPGDSTTPPPANNGGTDNTADNGGPLNTGGIDLGGLIPDAVNDTQELANDVTTGVQDGGTGLIDNVLDGTGQLLGNALDNLGLGNTVVGGVVDGLTGNGIDLGNVVGSIVGPGSILDAGVLPDGNSGILQPVSDLTDGILGSPNGDGAILDLGVIREGSPAVTSVFDQVGDGLLGDLGLGQIADVTGPQTEDGDPAASATVGQPQGSSGPLVTAQAFGNDQPSSSNNLINLGAGENGEQSSIIADVLGGTADNSNPTADANVVDVGPNGQELADASVLTSPDQFAFQILDGAGTDSLAGILGTDASGTVASLVPTGFPVLDLGTDPIIDLNLSGDANAGNETNPLQAALNGQLLGSA